MPQNDRRLRSRYVCIRGIKKSRRRKCKRKRLGWMTGKEDDDSLVLLLSALLRMVRMRVRMRVDGDGDGEGDGDGTES